ncbi:pirin-like C-terminal cupin domain-containing protein [Cryobacterium levicorallinum]|uniref:Pirin C-terminal domain-containing protein n=1 Tax=Cryobacterium levicorallinum TaxID=995038 RepID=A0ABY1EGJ0_9MICO|nr:pirin-like C-terminal cupin domain-containing protein [Cryobacterium levicorallinum]SFH76921.1 hypothetical protein SAMN05216274_11470 [Cryobacterium levicorallinum]
MLAQDHLAYLPIGRSSLTLDAGADPVRLLLVGGEPLGEQNLRWWNFVGRSDEEIVSHRAQWQTESGAADDDACFDRDELRFGAFPDGEPVLIPAPPLPTVRLRFRS